MDVEKLLEIVKEKPSTRADRLAGVQSAPSGGTITVKFETDETTSPGTFAYLVAYTASNQPAPGDRVLMGKSGNTYVVLGKLSTSA